MTRPVGWVFVAGQRPARVVAEERLDRAGVIYLRWRQDGGWEVRSTGLKVRDKSGALAPRKVAAAERAAKDAAEKRAQGLGIDAETATPLTIREGLARAIDPKRGIYPMDTPHRREVVRELERAAIILNNMPWNAIRPGDIRALYRSRLATLTAAGDVGVRGAEITVTRLLTIAEWLKGEGDILPGACVAPKRWRSELKNEGGNPEPKRPRHTLAELRAIIAHAATVDPRLALALAIGAEQRGGQVCRIRRSHLHLAERLVRIPGAGKKIGAVVELTDGQLAAVHAALAGYLRPLEDSGLDYPLFPAGQLTGGRTDASTAVCRPEQQTAKPVTRDTMGRWFAEAEALAGVPHVEGRLWYGGRRVSVDEAKKRGISREGLQAHGGWSDTQMPDKIYAEQGAASARHEAALIRADIRGETEAGNAESVTHVKAENGGES